MIRIKRQRKIKYKGYLKSTFAIKQMMFSKNQETSKKNRSQSQHSFTGELASRQQVSKINNNIFFHDNL